MNAEFFVVGINHKTAHVDIREKISFVQNHEVKKTYRFLKRHPSIKESMVLSTCNRFEIYALAHDVQALRQAIINRVPLSEQKELQDKLYIYQGEAVFRHLLRVATGLDSSIVGEPHIQEQLEKAFEGARMRKSITARLSMLMEKALIFSCGIRDKSGLEQVGMRTEELAIPIFKQHFSQLSTTRVLVVGTGTIGQGVAQALYAQGVKHMWIASRTEQNAQLLAQQCGGQAIPLENIHGLIPEIDILVLAIKAEQVLIPATCFQALIAHRQSPMVILDLSVPRVLDLSTPQMSSYIHTYNIDAIRYAPDSNTEAIQHAIHLIEQKVMALKTLSNLSEHGLISA